MDRTGIARARRPGGVPVGGDPPRRRPRARRRDAGSAGQRPPSAPVQRLLPRPGGMSGRRASARADPDRGRGPHRLGRTAHPRGAGEGRPPRPRRTQPGVAAPRRPDRGGAGPGPGAVLPPAGRPRGAGAAPGDAPGTPARLLGRRGRRRQRRRAAGVVQRRQPRPGPVPAAAAGAVALRAAARPRRSHPHPGEHARPGRAERAAAIADATAAARAAATASAPPAPATHDHTQPPSRAAGDGHPGSGGSTAGGGPARLLPAPVGPAIAHATGDLLTALCKVTAATRRPGAVGGVRPLRRAPPAPPPWASHGGGPRSPRSCGTRRGG